MKGSRPRWQRLLGNVGLFFLSCALALLLCEFVSRLVLDRVDYLSPTLVRDDILGIRLPGGSGGHDTWGFRNKTVPKSAEIVALGDSHTYGNCAKMSEAWPKVLERLTGQNVYNLGMGGYGPNQYYHLLLTRALSLKPRTVVCGLYMGDDFDNAYRITYGLDHWSSWRRGGEATVDPDIWEKNPSASPGAQKRLRIWLSGHSVLYRVIVHGLLSGVKGRVQLQNVSRLDSATALLLPEKKIQEAFLPKGLLRGLNQEEAGVREGMRLTFDLLKQMNSVCATNHARFLVVVIPTKETVFARYLENNPKLPLADVLGKVIVNERAARQELFRTLEQANIAFVDALPALEKSSETERLYTFGASDMHPEKNGYRVIAEAIASSLAAVN